ncbi:hypothetical protein C2S51_006987 [Perilla frutescens var. frutescens]|nr:hypothetical protein C2S51_006987 [Perilla frutescens var. frutescens]
MADPHLESVIEFVSHVVSSDEDKNRGVKNSRKKTPITRSSNKSNLSGLRRPPLTSVGNRELRDLSKFAKGTTKMDLMKDKKRVKRKSKKDDKLGDNVSSHGEIEGDKEVTSDFSSEGKFFEQEDICYDTKPLQVMEAGYLMEKSFVEVAEASGALKQLLKAERGLERGDGSGKLHEVESALVRDREDENLDFSSEIEIGSGAGMVDGVDRSTSELHSNEFDEVEFQREEEEDRRLSEMEFNKYLIEDGQAIDFQDRLSVSDKINLGNLTGNCPETGVHCRNNLQKPIVVDRPCEESNLAFDRKKGRVDSYVDGNQSRFIQSTPLGADKERDMIEGNVNHDPLNPGRDPYLPILNNAAPPPLFTQNPNFTNPNILNHDVVPTPILHPSDLSQTTQPIHSNPTACQEPNPVNPRTMSYVSTLHLTQSASLPNLKQLQKDRHPILDSSLVNSNLAQSILNGSVSMSRGHPGSSLGPLNQFKVEDHSLLDNMEAQPFLIQQTNFNSNCVDNPGSGLQNNIHPYIGPDLVNFPPLPSKNKNLPTQLPNLPINPLIGPFQQNNPQPNSQNNSSQPSVETIIEKIPDQHSDDSPSMELSNHDVVMHENMHNAWGNPNKGTAVGRENIEFISGSEKIQGNGSDASLRFLDALRAPTQQNGPVMFNASTIKDIGSLEVRDGMPVLSFNRNDHEFLAGRMGLTLVGKFSHAIPSPANIEKVIRNIQITGNLQVPHRQPNARQHQPNPNHSRPQQRNKGEESVSIHATAKNASNCFVSSSSMHENDDESWERVDRRKKKPHTPAAKQNTPIVRNKFSILQEVGLQPIDHQIENPSGYIQRDMNGFKQSMERGQVVGVLALGESNRQQLVLTKTGRVEALQNSNEQVNKFKSLSLEKDSSEKALFNLQGIQVGDSRRSSRSSPEIIPNSTFDPDPRCSALQSALSTSNPQEQPEDSKRSSTNRPKKLRLIRNQDESPSNRRYKPPSIGFLKIEEQEQLEDLEERR